MTLKQYISFQKKGKKNYMCGEFAFLKVLTFLERVKLSFTSFKINTHEQNDVQRSHCSIRSKDS